LDQSNCFGKNEILLIKMLNKQSSSVANAISSQGSINPSEQTVNSSQSQSIGIIPSRTTSNDTNQDKYCKLLQDVNCIECYSNFHL
jgi:hypothetical protein